jgi:hypothetical protein
MPASFLNGVEVIEVERGLQPFRVPRTAVIGLVGTAPMHLVSPTDRTVNKPMLVRSARDAARLFGTVKDSTGYTIPKALDAIAKQGGALVIVINVFDPARHRALGSDIATAGSHSVTNNLATVSTGAAHGLQPSDFVEITGFTGTLVPLNQSFVRVKTVPSSTTFTFDLTATAITSTASTDGTVRKITFAPATVLPSDIIGGTTATGRYGMEAFRDAMSLFNFAPKILISPSYSPLAGVREAMDVMARALRGVCIADMPAGTNVQDAIQSRGTSGPYNYNTGSSRMLITFPHLMVYDVATDTEEIQPYSQFLAGVIAASDTNRGYWWSPSNTEIDGIIGTEFPLTSDETDENSDANVLNEVGIVATYSSFGTGVLTWGNRSAMWPSNPNPKNFINVRRTADVIDETIKRNSRVFLARPIQAPLIEDVLDSVNAFLNTLAGIGAILPGAECTFNPDDNPVDQLALGKLKFQYAFMPPTPLERLTYESFVDINLLKNAFPATT